MIAEGGKALSLPNLLFEEIADVRQNRCQARYGSARNLRSEFHSVLALRLGTLPLTSSQKRLA